MPEQNKLSLLSRISLIIAAPSMKFALPMLLILLVATAVLIKPALNIQNDDDVIKFLPQDDPKVVKFMEIGDEFHGLQMAIVGVEAKRNEDLFNYEDMMLIRRISRELTLLDCTNKNNGQTTKCVSNTTSFSEIKDISHHSRDTGEVEASVTDLVPDLPAWESLAKEDPEIQKLLDDANAKLQKLGESNQDLQALIKDLQAQSQFIGDADPEVQNLLSDISAKYLDLENSDPEIKGILLEAQQKAMTLGKNNPEIKKILDDAKARSLSLEHVNGFLVSPDARAAAIYAQVDDVNVSTKEAADKIREHAEKLQKELGVDVTFYYGGSPFIGGYSADQARTDMTRLSPWVIAIVVLIILITSKSLFATIIALVSVGISMVWVMGGMALMDIKMTLVATSLPVLLVALGSAYAIHLISAMLAQLDKTADSHSNDQAEQKKARIEAMRKALILTGPPIIVCVLTTAAGFFSFLTMDVEPMVEYGASMGIATLIIMFVTFWFVTSACIICPIKPRKGDRAPAWAMKAIKSGADGIYKHYVIAGAIVAALAIAAGYFTTKVEPHGDNTSLFAEGSLPRLADEFMDKNFGGSNFIQTEVRGDVIHPLVLRQVERITALINAHPRIAGMQSFSDVAVLVGDTMGEGLYIPPSETLSASMANNAYQDDKSTSMLVTRKGEGDYPSTLMQIRVAGTDISEGARLADELNESSQHLYGTRIFVPRDLMDDAAKQVEQKEIIEHLKNIFTKYNYQLSDDAIASILNDPSTTQINKDYVRETTHIYLFDEDDAQLFMDENKIKAYAWLAEHPNEAILPPAQNTAEIADNADAAAAAKDNADNSDEDDEDEDTAEATANCTRTDKSPECIEFFAEKYDGKALDYVANLVYDAMMNKTYNKEWLTGILREFAEDDELDPDKKDLFDKSVTFIMEQYRLDVFMKSPRTWRLTQLFEKAGVTNPSDKFKERVEGAIWCLGDDVASLPKDQISPVVYGQAKKYFETRIAEELEMGTAALAKEPRHEDIETAKRVIELSRGLTADDYRLVIKQAKELSAKNKFDDIKSVANASIQLTAKDNNSLDKVIPAADIISKLSNEEYQDISSTLSQIKTLVLNAGNEALNPKDNQGLKNTLTQNEEQIKAKVAYLNEKYKPEDIQKAAILTFADFNHEAYARLDKITRSIEILSNFNADDYENVIATLTSIKDGDKADAPDDLVKQIYNHYLLSTKNELSADLHRKYDEQSFEVIPSGYPVIYRAMNASVIHNQFWSLGASFIMVFLCLLFFTKSPTIAACSLVPASLTVLLTFGTMGLFDIGMDVGSSMIAAISLSVGIDYACHLLWKFGRPGKDEECQQKASDHMLETTGWGIVINALEVGLGLSVLYFGELLPMKTFGLLTGLAMIVSAAASLLLLSGLLRFATKFHKAELFTDALLQYGRTLRR